MHPIFARLRGIVPSLNTPFTAQGGIDEDGVRRLVERTVEARCAGMLVLAVAAENRWLTLAERDRIGRIVAETNAGRLPIIVNVTGSDLGNSVALARQARAAGADALCYQVDTAKRPPELREELDRLAGAGPDLTVVQDLDWSGPGLPLAAIEHLRRHCPHLQGIKIETVLAGPKYSAVLSRFGGTLHVSGGWAAGQMIDALHRGVHAFMPTAMDHAYARVHELFQAGRKQEAQDAFEPLLPILAFTQQHIDISIVFLKRLRRAEGLFATGAVRCGLRLDAIQRRIADGLVRRAAGLDALARAARVADAIAMTHATQ